MLELVDSLHLLDLVKDTNAENLIAEAYKAASTASSDASMERNKQVEVGGGWPGLLLPARGAPRLQPPCVQPDATAAASKGPRRRGCGAPL